MYLRFTIAEISQDSGQELGITLWFDQHLKKPGRFTASKPPFSRKKKKAISWFKDTAHEHLSRIRELVAILEHHGVPVRMLKAKRAGYIVYEDEFQIVAEPFAD